MDEATKIEFFQTQILKWFEKNKRKFIWRNASASNYVRIISEVFLQRTRAETVNKYLSTFLKKYPSWSRLGDASENDLVQILKPLGLSSQRGKRLFKLAQELKNRNGLFPKERSVVEEMPMMGQYIANAFELFILKKPLPLLDVNMARLLERYFGERKLADIRYDPYLQELSKGIITTKEPIEMNWAILDFSGLVCKSKPLCERCPLKVNCNYFSRARVS